MIITILTIIVMLVTIMLLTGAVYLISKGELFKTFYHDVLEWHLPNNEQCFDGCSFHAICKICNKEIMQDSQGNWF